MSNPRLLLILGHCLFPDHGRLRPTADDVFFMAEDYGLCTHFRYHKQKLVLFLSAMRSHADTLVPKWNLIYWKLTAENRWMSYEAKLLASLVANPEIREVVTYIIEDAFFDMRIRAFCEQHNLKLTIVESPAFVATQADFAHYLSGVKKPFMHTFYQRQRKSHRMLVDVTDNPLHGKWSFDQENRQKLPKGHLIPVRPQLEATSHTVEVSELVADLFPDHVGHVQGFNWATTREQALDCLQEFLEVRLQHFGPYEDAIEPRAVFLYHSALSPYLNMGLLLPEEVLNAAVAYAESHPVHFPSLEGFIRQILGWREFVRGIYHHYGEQLSQNHLHHYRKLKPCWYDGTTGVLPLDDSIKKAIKHGYTHHIERLMVIGNIMLLCELDPDEVYRWFMEMYVDSADWVMAPNVYGMSQYADGGIFATKPYIAGSNYILKMSSYAKSGDWPEIMNGLYWRFIDRNRQIFESNPRMSMAPRTFDKMETQKKQSLISKAEKFIDQVTC